MPEDVHTLLRRMFTAYKDREEKARRKNTEKLIDFYNGDQTKYTKQYITLEKLDDFPFYATNVTKRIINKVSEVYKLAPIRVFEQNQDEKYNKIAEKKSVRMKVVERMANLLGVVGVRPVVRERDGKKYLDYVLLRDFTAFFDAKDPLKPKAILYEIQQDSDEKFYEFWTDEYHLLLNNDRVRVSPEKLGLDFEEENPYGVIPFAWCHSEQIIDDFYNTAGNADDLIEANLHINLMLSEFAHKYRYVAFNQPYIVGVDPTASDINYGYNEAIVISDPEATVGTLTTQADFNKDIEALKFQIQLIERNYHLSLRWGLSGSTSGFQLIIENIDHYDDLKNARDVAKEWEQEIIDMERVIGETEGVKIPQGELAVDFAEVSQPISQQEKNQKWEFEFTHKLATREDYWREENPDITDEELEAKHQGIVEGLERQKEAEKAGRTAPTIEDLLGTTD